MRSKKFSGCFSKLNCCDANSKTLAISQKNIKQTPREKCPNTEFFLVRIFLYSVQIQENTDKKKLRIWTLFKQWDATCGRILHEIALEKSAIKFSKIFSEVGICHSVICILFWTHSSDVYLPFTVWNVSKQGVFSGPYFPAFGLNTERSVVSLCIQSECRKICTRKNSVFGYF